MYEHGTVYFRDRDDLGVLNRTFPVRVRIARGMRRTRVLGVLNPYGGEGPFGRGDGPFDPINDNAFEILDIDITLQAFQLMRATTAWNKYERKAFRDKLVNCHPTEFQLVNDAHDCLAYIRKLRDKPWNGCQTKGALTC